MEAAIISYARIRAFCRPEEVSIALDSTTIEKLAKGGLRLCLRLSSKHNWEGIRNSYKIYEIKLVSTKLSCPEVMNTHRF